MKKGSTTTWTFTVLLAGGVGLGLSMDAYAADALASDGFRFQRAGARSGFSATSIVDQFYQTEAFVRLDTPWRVDLGAGWRIRTEADFSVGLLARGHEKGAVATAGPAFAFGHDRFPIEFLAGCSASLLSRDEFDAVNFGIPFQFTSHVGFDFHFGTRVTAGYRMQHMSNAGFSGHNPGLDLHSFAIAYHF